MKKYALKPFVTDRILIDKLLQIDLMYIFECIEKRTVTNMAKRNDPCLTQYAVLKAISNRFQRPIEDLLNELPN